MFGTSLVKKMEIQFCRVLRKLQLLFLVSNQNLFIVLTHFFPVFCRNVSVEICRSYQYCLRDLTIFCVLGAKKKKRALWYQLPVMK